MFNYEYQDADQDFKPIGDGPANFIIHEVDTKDAFGDPLLSKAGAPKIVVKMKLSNNRGESGLAFEHITAKNAYKLGQICNAIGRPDLYGPHGDIDPEILLGKSGTCNLVKEGKYVQVQEYNVKVAQSMDEIPF